MILNLPLTTKSNENYLETISKIPLLSAEQEYNFAIEYYETKDKNLEYSLVVSNLRFVAYIARDFINYGLPLADLIQEGTIGLIKAIQKFDPYAGVRLITYAAHWIKSEIYEYIIKNWKIVKIATTKAQRKLFFNIRKSSEELGKISLDGASDLAARFNVEVEDVFEMEKRLVCSDINFDPIEEDDFAPGNYLAHKNSDPASIVKKADIKEYKENKLYEALSTLDERSQDIVKCRWLNEEKDTLEVLATRYNISKERVRQLEQQALKKLKSEIKI